MKANKANNKETVDEWVACFEHPLKTEIIAVREIIAHANPRIQERIKWNSPSFYYKDYDLAAFHTRPQDCVHIVFVFYHGDMLESEGLLEGDYKDRRMAKLYSMEDIVNKKTALEKVVNDWVALIDRKLE